MPYIQKHSLVLVLTAYQLSMLLSRNAQFIHQPAALQRNHKGGYCLAEFILETRNMPWTGKSSIKTHVSVNLRTGNFEFYGVFDEIDVRLRFPILSSSAPFCLLENVVPVFYCARSVYLWFTRLIYPSKCEFRTRFRSRRDSCLTFPSIWTRP